jgi:hypothetical protein
MKYPLQAKRVFLRVVLKVDKREALKVVKRDYLTKAMWHLRSTLGVAQQPWDGLKNS